MIQYAITRRDRLAYRLAVLALRVATPSYRRFCELCWKRGLTDLYEHPPVPGEAHYFDGDR